MWSDTRTWCAVRLRNTSSAWTTHPVRTTAWRRAGYDLGSSGGFSRVLVTQGAGFQAFCEALEEQNYVLQKESEDKDRRVALLEEEVRLQQTEIETLKKSLR